jgi:hypothetical protein
MVKTKVNRSLRMSALLAALVTAFSLLTAISPGMAYAESISTLKWATGPVNAALGYGHIVTAPNGDVTVGCSLDGSGQDLITYNSTGSVVRQISRTSTADGVNNCIGNVVMDKNAAVYGVPLGRDVGGSLVYGPNLLAYSANKPSFLRAANQTKQEWEILRVLFIYIQVDMLY